MNSPIKWVGGKYRLIKKILPLIPEHTQYIEVFGGAGWLLFAKTPSKVEVLNDLNDDLTNFWSIIQKTPQEFIKNYEFEIVSRSKFNYYKDKYTKKDYKNNVDRAVTFYYLIKAGVGARLPDGGGTSFGVARESPSRLNLKKLPDDISQAHKRLENVTIECKDFRDIIKFYDGPNTFFYLDPPYRNCKNNYSTGEFTDKDYEDLATICKSLEGNFLLSINDDSFIRKIFDGFDIQSTETYYSMNVKKEQREKQAELFIKNY